MDSGRSINHEKEVRKKSNLWKKVARLFAGTLLLIGGAKVLHDVGAETKPQPPAPEPVPTLVTENTTNSEIIYRGAYQIEPRGNDVFFTYKDTQGKTIDLLHISSASRKEEVAKVSAQKIAESFDIIPHFGAGGKLDYLLMAGTCPDSPVQFNLITGDDRGDNVGVEAAMTHCASNPVFIKVIPGNPNASNSWEKYASYGSFDVQASSYGYKGYVPTSETVSLTPEGDAIITSTGEEMEITYHLPDDSIQKLLDEVFYYNPGVIALNSYAQKDREGRGFISYDLPEGLGVTVNYSNAPSGKK